jgi:outer membrane protein
LWRSFGFLRIGRWGKGFLPWLFFGLFTFWAFPVQAEPITLKAAIEKAVACSYEAKIARVDIALSQTDVASVRADYLPTVRANANIEYLKDLEKQFRPVTSVGSTILPSGTRFQNSVGIQVNHTLIDFGERAFKVRAARQAVRVQNARLEQILRDLKAKLIDVYAEALQSARTIQAQENLLTLAQSVYQLKKRLYEAGTLSKVDLTNQAIDVAQTLDDLQSAREQLEQHLQHLSYFTQEAYDTQTTELADLETDLEDIRPFNVEKTPEAREFTFQIGQKEAEIGMLKRQNLPQVSLYSYYNLYGFDPERFKQAVSNLSQRTISLGLSVNMPVFDGFKNRIAIHKAQLEKEKLVLQREEKLAQLKQQADTYQTQLTGFAVQLDTRARILKRAQYKQELVNRLSSQQLVDKTQTLQADMEAIRKGLNAEKLRIQALSILKKRHLLEAG